jgi:hypothetical protein
MRHALLFFAILLVGCQAAGASELTERRQPLIMLDAYGWRHDRGHVVQEEPGNVYLALTGLVHGSRLESVSVSYKGPPGHTSGHVVSKPVLWVWQQDEAGKELHLSSQPDASSAEQYVVAHRIMAHVGSTVDLASYHYFIRLTSEQGDGWLPGGRVLALMVETEPAPE